MSAARSPSLAHRPLAHRPLAHRPLAHRPLAPLRGAVGLALALLCACGTELRSRNTDVVPAPQYRPGDSIADAHVCACEECVERACCNADDEPAASTTELGLTLATCGGCYRRVWTVRGGRSCEQSAPAECCARG